jgi:hypothetical protein
VKELITHSRQAAFKACRRKHYFAYERGLRRTDDARALRMGSAFHDGVEQLGNGLSLGAACDAVRTHYDRCPTFADPLEWSYELETLLRLVCAYQWKWQGDALAYVAVELPFNLPLTNPATGKASRWCARGGKIDGIVRMEDGRLALKETKLYSEDVSQESTLWRVLRMDEQISLYMNAARDLGYPVEAVLYDVARKPTIKPGRVAILDELGAKIVLDASGDRVKTDRGMYRQTGDKERGYVLQERAMTAEEWGDKLSADIGERPDFYFARVEVARLDQDLAQQRAELWEVQQAIRDAQKFNRHYRTVNKMHCPYCPYFEMCSSGRELTEIAPDGFEFVGDKHPELGRKEEPNGSSSTPETTPPAADAQWPAPSESYW